MKLRNKLIKTVAHDNELRNKITLYSNYTDPDINKTRYVMTDINDIVICNEEDIESYIEAGFSVFGSADSEEELQKIVAKAEVS